MEVVRHQLEGPNVNLGIELGYIDKILDDRMAKCRWLNNGGCCLAVACEGAEQRSSFFHYQGYHVDAAALVVMPNSAPFHRRLQVASPLFLAPVPLPIHSAKISQLCHTGKISSKIFNIAVAMPWQRELGWDLDNKEPGSPCRGSAAAILTH